ncbi:MAG: hypothetical protein P4L53_15665 [Candidatus Obscuribacterales bacterium]|nr:hypothetical protein [Candidatus Obscuribacterales bacterium]
MTKFEAALNKGDQGAAHSNGDSAAAPPFNQADNHNLINNRPKDTLPVFGNLQFVDSTKDLHPQGALSPEGPPAKLFDGLGPNQQRDINNVIYARTEDADGTQRRVVRDLNKDTRIEDVAHPDQTTELIKSSKGFRESKSFDANGGLRSDTINADKFKEGKEDKFDLSVTAKYDEHGNVEENNSRWRDAAGTWHEDNFMKMSDGGSYHVVMDGNVTTKKMVNADGSWTQDVQTRDVEQIDPATGRHYKTMTNDYTSSPKPEKTVAPQ